MFPSAGRRSASTGYLRGSVHVKLVAELDVEHEVASVQVLHHKEEVLLDKRRRGHC